MYKIKNNYAPAYLCLLCPPNTDKKSDYKLRTGHNIQQIKTKKTCFHTPFLPSTIHEWKNLSTNAEAALSLEVFKSGLKSKINLNEAYLWHNDSASINLSWIRMGLSALNQHCFHLIASGNCPHCDASTERVSHYFLHCPNFVALRMEILQDLNDVLSEQTHKPKFRIRNIKLI